REDAEHRRGGEGRSATVIFAVAHDLAEQRQIHDVADDARPEPVRGTLLGQDSNAGGDLADAKRTHERRVAVAVVDTADLRYHARHEDLRRAEAEAEPTEEIGELFVRPFGRARSVVCHVAIRRRRAASGCSALGAGVLPFANVALLP